MTQHILAFFMGRKRWAAIAIALLSTACGTASDNNINLPLITEKAQEKGTNKVTRPNIVFILADDLGISDINAYA